MPLHIWFHCRFGESIGGSLVVGNIAWPHPKVVEIGSLLSTIGAGLQSLTGAPRLLQAISKDQIIPFLKPFETLSGKGEPVRALAITLVISEVAVLIGKDVTLLLRAPKVHLLLFSFLAQLLANFARQEKTSIAVFGIRLKSLIFHQLWDLRAKRATFDI